MAELTIAEKLLRMNKKFITKTLEGDLGGEAVKLSVRLYKLTEFESDIVQEKFWNAVKTVPVAKQYEDAQKEEIYSMSDKKLIEAKVELESPKIKILSETVDIDKLDAAGKKKEPEQIEKERKAKAKKVFERDMARLREATAALFKIGTDENTKEEVDLNRNKLRKELLKIRIENLRMYLHEKSVFIPETLVLALRENCDPLPGEERSPQVFESTDQIKRLNGKLRDALWASFSDFDSVAASDAEAKKSPAPQK